MDPRFSRGGKATLEKHGKEHFKNAQKRSWDKQLAENPNAGRDLANAGKHAREVKRQEYIKSQIEVKEQRRSILQTLLGTKNTS